MNARNSAFLASLMMLSATPPPPLPPDECRTCGATLDGIDKISGQSECRACRAPTIMPHGGSIRTISACSNDAPISLPSHEPIDMRCPTCNAKPGTDCDRRTMGRRWMYHRARVNAATGRY